MPTPRTPRGGRPAPDRRVRDILARCRAERIQVVRFLYCDNGGVIRGKACHTRFLLSYLESGIGLTVAMQSMNMLDQLVPTGSFGPVGEIRLVPDLDSFAILPYVPRTARLMCRMETLDGAPWGACPRAALERVLARAAEQGLMFMAAFENEFTLARKEGDRYAPIDRSNCFSTVGMD